MMTRINLAEELDKGRRPMEKLLSELRRQGIDNEQTIQAISQTPRQCFLEEALWHRAYENSPLPIPARQTISQPYMVARMTQLLVEHSPGLDTALEIGTGSGYQACVLSRIFGSVYTLERIETLHNRAVEIFRQLACINVYCELVDGNAGWAENAPYQAIIVTAAITEIPQALKQQLVDGGVIVAPLGDADKTQMLTLIKKTQNSFEQQNMEAVRFVPVLPGIISE